MSGQLKYLLLLVCIGGALVACKALETSAPSVSAEAQVESAAESSPLPSEETHVDISGCWKEVQLLDERIPVSSNFNIYKVEANAFTFHKPPQHTKYVVKESLTFQEVNYDDKKPFLPVGTIFSAGNISDNGDTINRFVNGQSKPHVYRRCQFVFGQPVEKMPETSETNTEQSSNPEPTFAPLIPNAPAVTPSSPAQEPPLPETPVATPTPIPTDS